MVTTLFTLVEHILAVTFLVDYEKNMSFHLM